MLNANETLDRTTDKGIEKKDKLISSRKESRESPHTSYHGL